MNTLLKKIALTLTFALSLMFVNPILEAKAYENEIFNFEEFEKNETLNNEINLPDLILNENEIKLANEYIQSQIDKENIAIMPRSLTSCNNCNWKNYYWWSSYSCK